MLLQVVGLVPDGRGGHGPCSGGPGRRSIGGGLPAYSDGKGSINGIQVSGARGKRPAV